MTRQDLDDKRLETIKVIDNLIDCHSETIRSLEDIRKSIENKDHKGNTLPIEYLDLDAIVVNEVIRDWSNIIWNEQNSDNVKDMKTLLGFTEIITDQYNTTKL